MLVLKLYYLILQTRCMYINCCINQHSLGEAEIMYNSYKNKLSIKSTLHLGAKELFLWPFSRGVKHACCVDRRAQLTSF
jgi:hypothetical protein